MRPTLVLLLLALLPFAAPAAEEPEAVYARFHRAIVAGDLEEMLRYATDAQRAELATMSAAQKNASVKMMAALMPRAFLLRNKTLNPDGKGARLVVSGPGQPIIGDKPEMLYGTIRMAMERGEWKVGEAIWNNTAPANLQASPGAAPKASPAPNRKAPVVGSMDASPERKLGVQKAPCVYKPVMSAEDLENCR